MGLEQIASNVESNQDLKNEINEAIKGCTEEADKVAIDTINTLNENQMATYIRKSFYDENTHEWSNYSQMRGNRYHAFMVQAAIDLLSDKYGDKKYNLNGEEAPEGGTSEGYKSLDDWLGEGGIDNTLGGKTSTAVKVLQNKWHFKADGLAGPQFFAKVCAELEGTSLPTEFRVKDKPNYADTFGFNRRQSVVINSGAENQSVDFDTPSDVEVRYNSGTYKIFRNDRDTGFTLSGTPGAFNVVRPDNYNGSLGNFTIDSHNKITYEGPAQGVIESYNNINVSLVGGIILGDETEITVGDKHVNARKIMYNGRFLNYYLGLIDGELTNIKGSNYNSVSDGSFVFTKSNDNNPCRLQFNPPVTIDVSNNSTILGLTEVTDGVESICTNYGIPTGSKIFESTAYPNDYCYKNGEGDIIFYPKNITSYTQAVIRNGSSARTESKFLLNAPYVTTYLNNYFKNWLRSNGLKTENKSIEFDSARGKYYVGSFGHKAYFQSTLRKDGLIFSGSTNDNLLSEIKMLNLINHIRDERGTSTRIHTYSFEGNSMKCERQNWSGGDESSQILTSTALNNYYPELKDNSEAQHNLCMYLNNTESLT